MPLEGEPRLAVVDVEVGDDGLPALELGLRIEILERTKLVERVTANRPPALDERPALTACDRVGREPR